MTQRRVLMAPYGTLSTRRQCELLAVHLNRSQASLSQEKFVRKFVSGHGGSALLCDAPHRPYSL